MWRKNLDLLTTKQNIGGLGAWGDVEGRGTADELRKTSGFVPTLEILPFWGGNKVKKNASLRHIFEMFVQQRIKEREQPRLLAPVKSALSLQNGDLDTGGQRRKPSSPQGHSLFSPFFSAEKHHQVVWLQWSKSSPTYVGHDLQAALA